MANFQDFKNISVKITLDTEDALIKGFIEAAHKSVTKRPDNLRTSDEWRLKNHIFKLFCEDKYISPADCAKNLNSAYGYNLRGEDVINIFTDAELKTYDDRMKFFTLISYKVEAFAKVLCTRNKNDYEEFDTEHRNLMKKFRRNVEL